MVTDDQEPPGSVSPDVNTKTPPLGRAPIIAGWILLVLGSSAFAFSYLDEASPTFPLIIIVLGISLITRRNLARWVAEPLTFERQLEETSGRINREAAAAYVEIRGNEGDVTVHFPEKMLSDGATAQASQALRRQEAILNQMYAEGLTQARLSFVVSMIFGSVGAILLLTGVGLAIFRAGSDGQRYASVVAAVSGTVIELTSGVFFLQSNRARRNMGDQAVLLREDGQEDRRLTAARELTGSISETNLQDEVRADLARALVAPLPKSKKAPAAGSKGVPSRQRRSQAIVDSESHEHSQV